MSKILRKSSKNHEAQFPKCSVFIGQNCHFVIRRLSKICCIRVLSAAQNGSVGRPVQNFVGFFKITKIRLLQSVI